MNAIGWALVDILVIFVAAKVVAEVCERLRQPAVVGEILVGMVLGPYALGLIGVPRDGMIAAFHGDRQAATEALALVIHTLAELGVVVLLFFVGLETRISDLAASGRTALLLAVVEITLTFTLGAGFMAALGTSTAVTIFTATVLVPTSVGVTARVLRDLNAMSLPESQIVLSAAVIDDILGMVVLAIVTALLGSAGGFALSLTSIVQVGVLLAQTGAFLGFVLLVGTRTTNRFSVHLERLKIEGGPFVVAVAVMLSLAVASAALGLAAVIGAFMAGMVLAEARERYRLEVQILPLYQLLVPIFFVSTGMQMNPATLTEPGAILLAIGLTVVAIVGKALAGSVAWGIQTPVGRWRSMTFIGVGMIPRGEVGLVIAGIGRAQGILDDTLFSSLIVMTLATTIVGPALLARLARADPRAGQVRPITRDARIGLEATDL